MKILTQFICSSRSAIPLYLFILKMSKLGSSLYNQKSPDVIFTPFWLQSTINIDSFVFEDLHRENEQKVEEFVVNI